MLSAAHNHMCLPALLLRGMTGVRSAGHRFAGSVLVLLCCTCVWLRCSLRPTCSHPSTHTQHVFMCSSGCGYTTEKLAAANAGSLPAQLGYGYVGMSPNPANFISVK